MGDLEDFTSTFGAPTPEEFLDLWTVKAKANGADVSTLFKSQIDGMLATSKQVVAAYAGDKREQNRLDALFALGKFNAEAETFLELDAWTTALLEVLQDLGETLLEVGSKVVVAGLVGSLKSGLAI